MNDSGFAVALTKVACPACGKCRDGDIVMNTRPGVTRKVQEMNGKVIRFEMCGTCQGVVDQGGTLLVEIDPVKSPGTPGGNILPQNAWRTGRYWGITGEAAKRIFKNPVPLAYIEPAVAEAIGLPDPEPETVQET